MIYLLSPASYDGVKNLPMIEFDTYEVKIDFDDIDFILFTSKQAVSSIEISNKKWRDIPAIAIGEATKNEIVKNGGTVMYTSKKFYGEDLTQKIIEKFSDKKILYLRPEIVSLDITTILLNANIDINEKIIYKTKCIQYEVSQQPPLNSIIIATSPSTLKCFIKNFGWLDSYTGVAIGKTTAKAFSDNMNFELADVPLISSCIQKAKQIQNIKQQ